MRSRSTYTISGGIMSITGRLPRVEARFNVVAPEGGYRRMLRSYDIGQRSWLDVEVDNLYGNGTFWLRITPDREEVVVDPKHDEVYLINKAMANFIDPRTGEEDSSRPAVEVWLNINTSVEVHGMPAGTLKMWELPLDISKIGR